MSGVRARLVDSLCEPAPQPGDFKFTSLQGHEGPTGMVFCCPCGCGDVSGIDFDVVPERAGDDQRWRWDGDRQAPTLRPSLHKTRGCGWHGWLTAGVFKSV